MRIWAFCCLPLAGLAVQAAATGGEARARPAGDGPRVLRVPEGVRAVRDLVYVTGGHERQRLDLYVPEGTEGPLPLLVWVHGGGWQNGSKEGCPPLREGYVERGYAVASLNYRLSGHAVFPAQIEDCKAALRWLRAHAAEYRLDPGRFGAWGSSAGGHLVALLGTSGDVAAFEVGENLDHSSRVQAVCDFYGPTDFAAFVATPGYESHARSESPEARLLGGAVQENPAAAVRANPITYVDAHDPPFLILHGDADPVVPINQSRLLFAALVEAGVSVHFHTIHGAGHGRGFGGPEIRGMVAEFFDRHLRGAGPATIEAKRTESLAAEVPTQGPRPDTDTGPSFDRVLRRHDRDRDGKLSAAEFPGPPGLFRRLDGDGDGALTRKEHENAFPARFRPPPEAPPSPVP
ncbi:MAG: alpha/beta hydrolase fold domain-containing protein [Lentisphaeria bacterium]|nr:alpha/beta hydrolase fold domain-containing protein [Lentisphaeria bacterium]